MDFEAGDEQIPVATVQEGDITQMGKALWTLLVNIFNI